MLSKVALWKSERDRHYRERDGQSGDLLHDQDRITPLRQLQQPEPERTDQHADPDRDHRLRDDVHPLRNTPAPRLNARITPPISVSTTLKSVNGVSSTSSPTTISLSEETLTEGG